jgi:hypothetical protein
MGMPARESSPSQLTAHPQVTKRAGADRASPAGDPRGGILYFRFTFSLDKTPALAYYGRVWSGLPGAGAGRRWASPTAHDACWGRGPRV